MSSSNCCFLTCRQISQEAGKVIWYSHLLKNFPQFVVIYTVKDFGIVNKTKIDVFSGILLLFNDPADVGNFISGSSAFSKSSLNIWKFTVHVLFKPGLENFEHYFTRKWVQLCGSLSILWHWLSLGLEWKLTFSSPVATVEFSKFAGILSAALSQHHLLGFDIAQLEFHHLTSFVQVMLPKAHLTLHSRMSGSRWVITPLWLSGSWRSFRYSSVYSCHLFLIYSASVRSIPFLSFIVPIFAWHVP